MSASADKTDPNPLLNLNDTQQDVIIRQIEKCDSDWKSVTDLINFRFHMSITPAQLSTFYVRRLFGVVH